MKLRALRYTLLLVALFGISLLLWAALPSVPTGTWVAAGNMSAARSGACTVALSDGRLLISGGADANGPTATADLFSTTGSWSAAASMNSPRSHQSCAVLQDGRVLVAGGTTSGGGITNAAEMYDPSADSWAQAGIMNDARSGATASVLQDGRVLIAGGQSSGGALNTLEIFDPNSGNFSNAGTMSSPRQDHAAAVLSDGRVLIAGGSSDGANALNTTDIYDPQAGSVSAGPAMSTARAQHTATTLLDGTVVVIGGSDYTNDLASAEFFDPAANNFNAASSLATARSKHSAFLLPKNNEVLVVGGQSAGTDLNSAELYIPWQKAFQATGAMATPRSDATGAALTKVDGRLLIAGGSDASGNALASTELYAFSTVKTDQADYAPGSIVTITGSGWQPGETVTLTLLEAPLIDTPPTMTAVADANGNILNNQFSPDLYDVNVRFYLTAVGSQSGFQAQNTFTDGTPKITNVSISPFSPNQATSAGVDDATDISATNQGGGTIADFRVRIHAGSTSGVLVREFKFTNVAANGNVTATWDGKDGVGNFVADGIYIALASNGTTETTSPASATGTVVVDNTNPTITLSSPADNAFVMGNNVPLVALPVDAGGDASNIGKVEFYIDSGLVSTDTSPAGGWNFNLNTTTLPDGSHTWFAKAFDKAGNNAVSATRTIEVDNTNPTIAVDPVSGASAGTPLTITGTAGDPGTGASGVASVFVTITGPGPTVTGNATNTGTNFSTWSFTYTPLAAQAGSNTVVAKATDNAGNFKNSAPVNFTITSIVNTTTTLSSTLNPSTYGDNVTFTANVHAASGATAPTGTITFTIDGTLGAPLALGACSPLSVTDACASTSTSSLTVNGGVAHTISASYAHTGNFNDSSGSLSGGQKVNPAPLTVTAGSYSSVYDGSSHALSACTVSANFDGLTCTNSPAGPVGPDVGSGTVTPVVSGSTSNYSVTTNNGSWSITALAVTLTGGSYSGVYDGSTHALSDCTSSNSTFVTCTNSPAGPVGPDVGGAPVNPTPVYAKGNATDYTLNPVAGSWSIAALKVTLTAGSLTGTYNGNAQSPSACSSDNPTFVTCANDPSSVGPDVGSGTVNVATPATYLKGNATDYTLNPVAGSWSIAALKVTLTAGSLTGTYNGNAQSPSACSSDNPTFVTCANDPSSVGPDVGSGAVSVVTPPNFVKGNATDYTIKTVAGSWSITPLGVTLTAGSLSATYNGNAQSPSACSSDNPTFVTCANNPSSVGPDVGSGTVNVATPAAYLKGNSTDYTLNPVAGSWSITQAPSTTVVTFESGPYVYRGTPFTATASVTGAGGLSHSLTVSYSGDCTNVTVTNGCTASASYGGDTNHKPSSDSENITIAKATATIVVTPYSVTYNGAAHTATGTAKGVLNENLSGLNLSGTTHTNPGDYLTDPWTFTDVTGNYNNAKGTVHDSIGYGACSVGAGGVILPPINSDGTSVYNRKGGSTIPVKFNVCGANGAPLTDPTLVFAGTGGALTMTGAMRGTITVVNEDATNDIPDAAFTWDGQQWHFNMATMNLSSGYTYTFRINLAYAPASIQFVVGVK
jgi:Bacterial Ig-like domain (group 3)/Bacterial Ig-like domain/Galactose oxidase, central domain